MSAKPATPDEIRDAILTVLGTLPVGCEMRFWWQDGHQHMSMQHAGQTAQVLYLNRREDGVGIPTPAAHH